jgi:4-hydroxybenzoate polyprenyltransferase
LSRAIDLPSPPPASGQPPTPLASPGVPEERVDTSSLAEKLNHFARDIKISHTVFALPFALLSTFLAAGGMPRAGVLGLILLCMVTARTVAMSANRLLDAALDARNPRTAARAIPSNRLSRTFYAAALAACGFAFLLGCAAFWFVYRNAWPVALALPILGFLCAYPLLKRFTRFCHYYLGAALALAPLCAWLAVRGSLAVPPLWMAAAVLCWTAGFDIIYACQDYRSDVECDVFSVPAKLGIGAALWVARLTHVVCVGMLVALGLSAPALGTLYWTGVAAVVALLVVEHSLVRPDDLSKVGLAFFTVNGVISVLLGTLGIADVFL